MIELLLVIGMMTLITTIAIPITSSFQTQNNFTLAIDSTEQMLRRAQILAQSGKEESSWGVSFQSEQILLFKGTSFASRDTSFDEQINLDGITFSGDTEVVFEPLTGNTSQPYTITVISQAGTQTLSVNEKGVVQ